MPKIVLTDGTARWFYTEDAETFEEDTRWDGNNHISCATQTWGEHEVLYRTKGKQWVLHHWSQWQGSHPTWELIEDQEAVRWLIVNGHSHEDVDHLEAELEIK